MAWFKNEIIYFLSISFEYAHENVSPKYHRMLEQFTLKCKWLRESVFTVKVHNEYIYFTMYLYRFHDDVIKWKHFPHYWSFLCWGNSPVTGELTSQGPVTRSFEFSSLCGWTNGWVNNRNAGDLRRDRAQYDVIVMCPIHIHTGILPFNSLPLAVDAWPVLG